ncbi:response regulator of citrate/malate metabolism [Neomicrococcus aestuarii]|uniref:Transcriptional regulatory protein n=1 Tax=Neomicrococcus aestuarii TaxID=556325 RepID=A0A7W8TTG2_9MICC|nr:response regulator [Neomicrococcus aestuarii]MBB5511708.1 response regulator of citrate/malate metabolism [Neomicrococcus aestuarii]
MADLRVLVIEDDPTTGAVYVEYLRKVPGFAHEFTARSVAEAQRFLGARLRETSTFGIDVVLMDIHLPDGTGLDVVRSMRNVGYEGSVLAMTAATDRATIRSARNLGAVQYLIKPFTFADFESRLAAFRQLSTEYTGGGEISDQAEIDRMFGARTEAASSSLPKGLTESTLAAVQERLTHATAPLSAGEVGEAVGISRVTSRRYLEHLTRRGDVTRQPRYGTPGRPEHEYTITAP